MLEFVLLASFVGLALWLAWFLVSRDRGEREPVMALWLAVGVGLAGAVMAGFLESWLVSGDSLLPTSDYSIILLGALSVAVIEEVCKFLPLAVLIYNRRYFNEHTDGVIYFALAGLGFGLPENILYTLQYGGEAGKLRLILTPLFHAAATGLVGYFLARKKLAKKSPMGVIMPLTAVILLHGLYDFGLIAATNLSLLMSLSITLGLSAGLFAAYLLATQRDQKFGLSAVGHNNFCRACGWPNKQHHLYCVHCGQRA